MERKEMIKYIGIFILLMFVISMFYNFSRVPTEEKKELNIIQGTATATCKVIGYSNEIIVEPWNEKAKEIGKRLKEEGYVDYINIIGNRGILIYSSKSNIEVIRDAYVNEDVKVYSQSYCSINGLVNFYLRNGSERKEAPGNLKIYLDPFTKAGEEIDVDLVAYISERGIESISAEPFTRTWNGNVDASFVCYDVYAIIGKIKWENRDVNISELYEFGIGQKEINYTKNDAVIFSKELNATEINELKEKFTEKGINATVYSKGMITNSIEKEKIMSTLSEFNITPEFPESYLIVFTDLFKKNRIEEYINARGSIFKLQKACDITAEKIGKRSDGVSVYIPENLRRIKMYVDIEKIPEDKYKTINVKYELIGMTAESMEIIDIK